jgi:hypothetical protein
MIHAPRPDIARELLIDAGLASCAGVRAREGAGVDQPGMQLLSPDAERILQRLPWARAVSVEGDRVAENDESRHL